MTVMEKNIVIPRCVIEAGPEAVKIYSISVGNGNKPSFAEMLALRKAPSAETEDTFLSNFGRLRDQFDQDDRYVGELVKAARKDGYNPGENDVYMPTIATKFGDPRAFIKSRAEARAVAEERGTELTVNGRTIVKHREPEQDPYETAPKLNDALVAPEVKKLRRENPKLSVHEAREAVIDKHGSKWK